jgi:hypothetical protein
MPVVVCRLLYQIINQAGSGFPRAKKENFFQDPFFVPAILIFFTGNQSEMEMIIMQPGFIRRRKYSDMLKAGVVSASTPGFTTLPYRIPQHKQPCCLFLLYLGS